jgi:hypothetical protein
MFGNKKNTTDYSLIMLEDRIQSLSWAFSSKEAQAPLVHLNFNSSNKIIYYIRTYKRISEVLANVGGLSNVLVLVFNFIAYFYSSFRRNKEIINSLYDFDVNLKNFFKADEKMTKKVVEEKQLKLFTLSPVQNKDHQTIKNSPEQISIFEKNNKFKNEILNQNKKRDAIKISGMSMSKDSNSNTLLRNVDVKERKRVSEYLKFLKKRKRTHMFSFSLHNYIKVACCSKCVNNKLKEKYQEYVKIEDIVTELLDLNRILTKIEDIEKLKMIILKDEQYSLFNFTSKYQLSDKYCKFNYITEKRNFLNDENNLMNLLLKVFNDENYKVTDIDKRLFQFMNNDMKSYFGTKYNTEGKFDILE